jgi:hypothetical protein
MQSHHRIAWLLLLSSACSAPNLPARHDDAPASEPAPTQPTAAAPSGKLLRIEDPSTICMLSNRYLGGKPQVLAAVEGGSYYGCCAGCAARLANTPSARTAIDPVTQHEVDKASAVLARDASNRVLYFENEATFARYGRD